MGLIWKLELTFYNANELNWIMRWLILSLASSVPLLLMFVFFFVNLNVTRQIYSLFEFSTLISCYWIRLTVYYVRYFKSILQLFLNYALNLHFCLWCVLFLQIGFDRNPMFGVLKWMKYSHANHFEPMWMICIPIYFVNFQRGH